MLVGPRYGGNVGAAARALKNCGFSSMRLVRPPDLSGEASMMAWQSLDLLHRARHFDSVEQAVADCHLVAAFSSRARSDSRDLVTLDEAVPRLLEAEQKGRVALLFGREDRGLTKEELIPASFLVNIPAAKDRRVYNLSQAVLLGAFQLRQAWYRQHARESRKRAGPRPLTAKNKAHLRNRVREILLALGYAEHADKGLLERMVTRSSRVIDRAGLDPSDQAMLLGILKRIERLGRQASTG
ncbi:MAG: RNA methyltransferase [Planctomycetota bacterium]